MISYESQEIVIKLSDPFSEQTNFTDRDAYNKMTFTEWGEEDGDFELEEEYDQSHQTQTYQNNDSQQGPDMNINGHGNNKTDENITLGQANAAEGNVVPVDEVTIDDITHFPPRDSEMKSILEEIEKLEQNESSQVNEMPVQSVLIDPNDVSTLEDEIIKSQQLDKSKKKTPKKSTARKKSKDDAESVHSATDNQSLFGDDYYNSDDENAKKEYTDVTSSITKSGRKVQRPIYFNPSSYVEPKKKSNDAKDPLGEPNKMMESKKTPKRALERRQVRLVKNQNKEYDELMNVNLTEKKDKESPDSQESQDPNNGSFDDTDPEIDNIVCDTCHEGLSEKGNWIILCDRCDTPYHQLCHNPIIDDEFADSDKEWICVACSTSHTAKRQKTNETEFVDTNARLSTVEQVNTPNTEVSTVESMDIQVSKVQAGFPIPSTLTREQKVEYFSSLPHSVLVNLILLAEQIQPNLPLYPANFLHKYPITTNTRKCEDSKSESSAQDLLNHISSPVETNASDISSIHAEDAEPASIHAEKSTEVLSPVSNDGSPSNVKFVEFAIYASMITKAVSVLANPNGSTAQTIYAWIKSNYAVPQNFQIIARKYLCEMLSKGVLVKASKMQYKLNPNSSYSYIKTIDDTIFKPLSPAVKQSGILNKNGQPPRQIQCVLNVHQSQQPNCLELSQQKRFGEQLCKISPHIPNDTIQRTNQSTPLQNSTEPSNQTSSLPSTESINKVNLTSPQQLCPSSKSGTAAIKSQNSSMTPVVIPSKNIILSKQEQAGQKFSRSSLSVASLMNNDQVRIGIRPPSSYTNQYNNNLARSGIRPPNQKFVTLNANDKQAYTGIPSRNSNTTPVQQPQIVEMTFSSEGNNHNKNMPTGIPNQARRSMNATAMKCNDRDQAMIGIRPANSIPSLQSLGATMNNNSPAQIGMRHLPPTPTNQPLSISSPDVRSSSIYSPSIQPIQPNPQQAWSSSSFNSYYMIPNSTENSYGILPTYSYNPNQHSMNYDGQSSIHDATPLMNGNHNGQQQQPRNGVPITPQLQQSMNQLGQSLSQR